MSARGNDLEAALARVRELIAARPAPADLAAALDAVGRLEPRLRRRLQAELLTQSLGEAAELAALCGWAGKAVIAEGQVRLDQDGAMLPAEARHFRGSGAPATAMMAPVLARLGVQPRTIVELGAGPGDTALYLARRYPAARVIALEPSPENRAALRASLGLQHPPLRNLVVAAGDMGDAPEPLRGLATGRIDFLIAQADPRLPGVLHALAGRIACAHVGVPADLSAEDAARLLAAIEAAGLAVLEKRSQAAEHPAEQLAAAAGGRVWLLQRRLLKRLAAPPRGAGLRGLVYAALNRLHRLVRTTDRRFEFEQLYREQPDPWNYRASDYEALKYRRALDRALAWRRRPGSVLELACSIGVFTRLLAPAFDEVTAVDISREALAIAARGLEAFGHVRLVRSDLRRLRLGRRFDVIFVAEVLYYLPRSAAGDVLATLKRHLAPDGVVILVTNRPTGGSSALGFDDWKPVLLEGGFRALSEENFEDPLRPYVIEVFELAQTGASD